MVKEIKGNFKEEVLEKKGLVLVDFWANWCGPCKMLTPIIHELAEEVEGISFTKVDVDDNGSIAMDYQVQSIPTVMIFKDGELVERFAGFRPKAEILDILSKYN
ncbi:thioredoxin [uncultured Clostridium sp.]|uniref:thioredoxin n=1 Tax=uncultured Clostridium sp. TaxID=59620 RepID=UPI002612A998|nr:thioredoxin [uncultured Clostridium sp.]